MINGIDDIKRKYSNQEIWLWPAQTKKNSEYLIKMNRNREAIENLIGDLESISKFFLVIPVINELNFLPGRPKASILCKITRYKALNLFKIKVFVNDLKEEEKTTLEKLIDSPKNLLEYLLGWQEKEIRKQKTLM